MISEECNIERNIWKLQANVYASHAKEDKEGNVAEPKTFELTRPASQGIKELAPGNNFYTQKFKLNVSGLNTFDWKDSLTVMKFCSKCDCVALKGDSGFEDAACNSNWYCSKKC